MTFKHRALALCLLATAFRLFESTLPFVESGLEPFDQRAETFDELRGGWKFGAAGEESESSVDEAEIQIEHSEAPSGAILDWGVNDEDG